MRTLSFGATLTKQTQNQEFSHYNKKKATIGKKSQVRCIDNSLDNGIIPTIGIVPRRNGSLRPT